MKEHILLEKAFRYKDPLKPDTPSNYSFNEDHGYWINNTTNEVLMLMKDRSLPQTKKRDRETGEDQKGE